MRKIRDMKQPKLSTILAAIAVFIVLGGTATAASGLINGKKIKKGTVTNKQLKNKTLTTAKFSPATVSALKGSQGPRGEKGERGAQGDPGPKGDTGIPGLNGPELINSYSLDGTESNVPANTDVDVVDMTGLDSSKYLVIAKANMFSNAGGAFVRCAAEANNSGGGDEAQWTSTGASSRNSVPIVFSSTGNITRVTVSCNPGNQQGSFTVDVVAIPIG